MIPGSLNTMMMGGGETPPVLDVVTNATVAYSSARRLRTGVSSPFNARKANSGVDQETIASFDTNGNLNVSALQTWVGANASIGISRWNDQTVNNNHANDPFTLLSSEPQIYSNSLGFFYRNSRVVPLFTAAQTQQLVFTTPITLASEFVIFCVQEKVGSGFGALISRADNEGTNLHAGLSVWNDGNTYLQDSSGFATATNAGTSLQVLAGSRLSGVRSIRVNGTALSVTNTTQTRNGVVNRIGRQRNGGSQLYSNAYIPEIIIYNRAMMADEIAYVENDMKTYYGIL